MRTAAVISSVKHAHLISAIARAVARSADVPKPRGVAVEVLMQLFTLPREERVAFAAELIKPDPKIVTEEDDAWPGTDASENMSKTANQISRPA